MDRSRYRIYRIPKASGGFREIMEPDPELKSRQRSILVWLTARRLRPSRYAHGFVKHRSTATHARLHTGRKVVLRIDIENFFPSISQRRVAAALGKEGIKADDAARIADLCAVDGALPQGAPTSPFLSNLVFKQADYRLAGLAKSWRAVYSRYADDLILSGDDPALNHIVHPVKVILEDEEFRINRRKFRVYRCGRRQYVTGIVVNRRATLCREERRKVRAALHRLLIAAVRDEEAPIGMRSVEGKAAYLNGIDPIHGREALRSLRDIKRILNFGPRVSAT